MNWSGGRAGGPVATVVAGHEQERQGREGLWSQAGPLLQDEIIFPRWKKCGDQVAKSVPAFEIRTLSIYTLRRVYVFLQVNQRSIVENVDLYREFIRYSTVALTRVHQWLSCAFRTDQKDEKENNASSRRQQPKSVCNLMARNKRPALTTDIVVRDDESSVLHCGAAGQLRLGADPEPVRDRVQDGASSRSQRNACPRRRSNEAIPTRPCVFLLPAASEAIGSFPSANQIQDLMWSKMIVSKGSRVSFPPPY